MKKKLLSLMLAMLMIMSLLPAAALAAETIPSATITIDAPVIGAQPDYTAEFPEGAHYYSDAYNVDNMRNDIGWMDLTEDTVMDPDSDVFQAGHQYAVYVYLTAQDGYKLADSTIATVTGQVAQVGMFGGQIEVIYVFPTLTAPGSYTAHVPEDKTLEYGNTEMQTIGDFWASDFENLPTPTLANVKISATCFTNGSNTIPFDFYWYSVNLDDPYYLWKVTETSGDRETAVVYQEDFHTTLYAKIEQSDWAAAVPGTYTATLTFNYSIEQDVGQGIPVAGTEKTLTTTLTVVVPEPAEITE